MSEQDHKNLLENATRRAFVTRLVGGAAIAPLIAASKAKAVPCADYLGPNLFNVYLSDPTEQTRALGVATFEVVSPDGCTSHAKITYTLKLTRNAVAVQGFLILGNGSIVSDLPLGTPAAIPPNPNDLCGFNEVLGYVAKGMVTMTLSVQVNGQTYTLTGKLAPAPNSQPISLVVECEVPQCW